MRRQALGVISNNKSNQLANTAANKLKPDVLKSVSSNSNVTNENEPPAALASKVSSFEFEIFQEEFDFKKSDSTASNPSVLINFAAKNGYNFESETLKSMDKENQAEYENKAVVFSNEYADDEDDDDYDYDEDEEEEDEDEAEHLEEEEEGISRLNIAGMGENSNDAQTGSTADLAAMDGSNGDHSPMLLDNTIKTQLSESSSEQIGEDDEKESLLLNCLEYKDEILTYMRQMELENRPKTNYMKKQQDITNSMRSILVDWLVEVSEEYKLNTETLYLAVNYTDRFLSQMSVLRGKLQLVGTASMYIASKYEEILPPDVGEYVYITDDTYTKKQVLRMEHLVLKVLDFRMTTPTANWFLNHYLRFLRASRLNTSHVAENLARYLAELTLIDAEIFMGFLPSQIAASAIYLALYINGKMWTKQISEQLGYSFEVIELRKCIGTMLKSMQQAAQHPQQAIQEKYKQKKFDEVAMIPAPKSLPVFMLQ